MSTAIKDIEYLANQTLIIDFTSGARYEYYNVPTGLVQDFLVAPSRGSFFNLYIKNNFKYSKVLPFYRNVHSILDTKYDHLRGKSAWDKAVKRKAADKIGLDRKARNDRVKSNYKLK